MFDRTSSRNSLAKTPRAQRKYLPILRTRTWRPFARLCEPYPGSQDNDLLPFPGCQPRQVSAILRHTGGGDLMKGSFVFIRYQGCLHHRPFSVRSCHEVTSRSKHNTKHVNSLAYCCNMLK